MKINRKYKVITKNLNVREGAGVSFKSQGKLELNEILTATEEKNGWVYTNKGWVNASTVYLKLESEEDTKVTKPKNETVKESNSKVKNSKNPNNGNTKGKNRKPPKDFKGITNPDGTPKTIEPQSLRDRNSAIEGDDLNKGYEVDINKFDLYDSENQSAANLNKIQGVFCMPYQFMSSADKKLSEFTSMDFPYGRKFTEKIVNRMPLLLLAPGRPAFMAGFKKSTAGRVLSTLIDVAGGGASSLEEMFDTNKYGRYYTFRFNHADYFDYVNGMCRASAVYLGLGSKKFNGTNYKNYNWETYANEGLFGFFSGSQYVAFYVDADNQISESFSNSTGESMLDQGLNRLSDLGKEVDFLLGAGFGVKVDLLNEDKMAQGMADAANQLLDFSNPANVLNRLKDGAMTIAAGGQLIFPEIWKDSYYSKNYSVSIKLTSPDGDTESIYRNILVPLWHILGFVIPMQMGYNGYRSPFLVKAIFKSLFNVEMGMIGSCSITKGGEGSWNIDGLPTEINVQLDIKDLYQILSMTKPGDTKMFFNNTQYLDFIATMCGLAIVKPEIAMKMEMYTSFVGNKVLDLPNKAMLKLNQTVTNALNGVLGWSLR